MQCDMKTSQTAEGLYLHVCKKCGARRTSDRPLFFRQCDATSHLDDQSPRGRRRHGKTMPRLTQQIWNLAKSTAEFIADGCKTVSADEYGERLEICDRCDHRSGNRCAKCGCYLALKARGQAFQCPAGKWPAVAQPTLSD